MYNAKLLLLNTIKKSVVLFREVCNIFRFRSIAVTRDAPKSLHCELKNKENKFDKKNNDSSFSYFSETLKKMVFILPPGPLLTKCIALSLCIQSRYSLYSASKTRYMTNILSLTLTDYGRKGESIDVYNYVFPLTQSEAFKSMFIVRIYQRIMLKKSHD